MLPPRALVISFVGGLGRFYKALGWLWWAAGTSPRRTLVKLQRKAWGICADFVEKPPQKAAEPARFP